MKKGKGVSRMEEYIALIVEAKKGNAKAFQSLIHQDKEKLYKMAYVYMRNEDDAIEVFQETVYRAFESIGKLRNEEYFSTWITRILINTAISHLRKRKRTVPMNKEVMDTLRSSTMNTEMQMDLLSALEQIEEKYKTVLLLRFYQDYTVNQIATILNCPEGTVKTNIRRGLIMLREKMKGVYHEERSNSIT